MILIPAVDIRGGKCVRLYQGKKERETVYGDDPAAAAARWQREGAKYLHLVDLDGAFSGEPRNLDSLREVLRAVTIPVEFGGGLRTLEAIGRVFKMGADRVIIGTAAVKEKNFLEEAVAAYGRRIFVGLDVRDGRLALEGWTELSAVSLQSILERLEKTGAGGVVCTDVGTDGTLSGPNFGLLERVLSLCNLRVIASGGIASPEHLLRLTALGGGKLYAAIVGRALYTGDLKLGDALKVLSGMGGEAGPC